MEGEIDERPFGHDCPRCPYEWVGARLRDHSGNSPPQRWCFRASGGHGVPGATPPREERFSQQPLDNVCESGRKRRTYTLTRRGRQVLADHRAVWRRFVDAISGFVWRGGRCDSRCSIANYLDTLARELSFDLALSRRVCTEIEDHLWQATDGCPSIEGQQQAIANFGDPRDIAKQYMTTALLTQVRWLGLSMIGSASTCIFLGLMKAKSCMVHAVMEWKVNAEWEAVRAIGLIIDRYGFIVAVRNCADRLGIYQYSSCAEPIPS